MKIPRTNWHSAAVDAIRITLRDYEHLLEYHIEYVLSGGAHRIDLLVIHKLKDIPIPHPIAERFSSYNIFEIKGISSSVNTHAYHKTLAYAALLIGEDNKTPPHYREEISLSFVCHHYPRKLVSYLTKKCNFKVANPFPGIYNIDGDAFPVQILVTEKLPPEISLYLRCLTKDLEGGGLVEQLAEDYTRHQNEAPYDNYMNQLINANIHPKKGVSAMCCEGIFRLYNTSSTEIAAKAAKEAVAPVQKKLNKTTEDLNKTSQDLDEANNRILYLQQLLEQNGIAYNT